MQTQRRFDVERKGERRPIKPKRWSHQDELQAMRGKAVRILILGETNDRAYTVIEADQFTLKVSDGTYTALIYKSAIARLIYRLAA